MNRRKLLPVAVVGGVCLVAAWVWFGRDADGDSALQASGTVEATEADLGFQVPGRVSAIAVEEGESVRAGAEVARLDAAELQARRAAAAAQVAAARALLAELERGAQPQELAQGEAVALAARQRMEEAAREAERSRKLFDGGAVSREQRDQAQTAYEVVSAQYAQARQQMSLVRQGPRAERIAAQRAVVDGALAMLAQADAALGFSVIRAPFNGVITLRHREPGEIVAPGQPVLTMMNPDDRWVRIYVPEDQVGKIALGSAARITSDSYPERSYQGQVVFIADRAEFTPRNVQTAEERVKLVYAVKVAIAGDREGVLKPGVPADVSITVR